MKDSINPDLDQLLNQYDRSKNIALLEQIATKLIDGERSTSFASDFPDRYARHIQTMQRMRIIGKDTGSTFTAGEQSRTEMSIEQKRLTISKAKTSGTATGEQLTQSKLDAKDGKAPTSYMVKNGNPTEILVEGVGGRFYAKFAGAQGSVTAKTRFVSNIDIFRPEQKKIRTGSRMLSNFKDSWSDRGPPAIVNDRIVVASDHTKEVKGYIATLVTAKFLQDWDAVGYGPNTGYIKQPITKGDRTLYSSAKIDPGNSFSFIARPENNNSKATFSNSTLGIFTNLNNSIRTNAAEPPKEKLNYFYTAPPLDLLDANDPSKFRPEACAFEIATKKLYPGFDTRDLLLGNITYAELSKSPKLYKQMAKAVESIANTSDEELHNLIYNNTPQTINRQNVAPAQAEMLEGLKARRDLMGKLYAKEIEYMKLYREAKANGANIDFETLKEQAQNIANDNLENTNKSGLKDANIPLTEELQDELFDNSSKLLQTALEAKDHQLAKDMLAAMQANRQPISDIATNLITEIEQAETKIITTIANATGSTALDTVTASQIKPEIDKVIVSPIKPEVAGVAAKTINPKAIIEIKAKKKREGVKDKIFSGIAHWLSKSSCVGSIQPETTPPLTTSPDLEASQPKVRKR